MVSVCSKYGSVFPLCFHVRPSQRLDVSAVWAIFEVEDEEGRRPVERSAEARGLPERGSGW